MFKWTISESIATQATQTQIWKLWADVAHWNQWDTDLEWSKLDDGFGLHAQGSLKPKGMGVYRFSIIKINNEQSFTTNTPMFLTSMKFAHEIESGSGVRTITHTVKVSGLMAPLLYCVMRKNLQKGLKDSLKKLVAKAEKGNNV